jgi:20S proteasome subunit alpha 4
MITGFSADGSPQLYLTDPAGTFSAWKANAIGGRNEKAVREFLEKSWTQGLNEDEAVRLAVKALLEVVDSGSKNMEVAIMRRGSPVVMMAEDALQTVIEEIEKEIEAAKAKKEAEDQARK